MHGAHPAGGALSTNDDSTQRTWGMIGSASTGAPYARATRARTSDARDARRRWLAALNSSRVYSLRVRGTETQQLDAPLRHLGLDADHARVVRVLAGLPATDGAVAHRIRGWVTAMQAVRARTLASLQPATHFSS